MSWLLTTWMNVKAAGYKHSLMREHLAYNLCLRAKKKKERETTEQNLSLAIKADHSYQRVEYNYENKLKTARKSLCGILHSKTS